MSRIMVFGPICFVCFLGLVSGKALSQNPPPASPVFPAPVVPPKDATKAPVSASTPLDPKASPKDAVKAPIAVSTSSSAAASSRGPTTSSPAKPSVHPIHQRKSVAKAVTAAPKTTRNASDKPKPVETTAKAITAKPANKGTESTSKSNPKDSVSKAVTPPEKIWAGLVTANPSKPGNVPEKPTSKPSGNDQIKPSSGSPPVVPK